MNTRHMIPQPALGVELFPALVTRQLVRFYVIILNVEFQKLLVLEAFRTLGTFIGHDCLVQAEGVLLAIMVVKPLGCHRGELAIVAFVGGFLMLVDLVLFQALFRRRGVAASVAYPSSHTLVNIGNVNSHVRLAEETLVTLGTFVIPLPLVDLLKVIDDTLLVLGAMVTHGALEPEAANNIANHFKIFLLVVSSKLFLDHHSILIVLVLDFGTTASTFCRSFSFRRTLDQLRFSVIVFVKLVLRNIGIKIILVGTVIFTGIPFVILLLLVAIFLF